MFWHTPRTPDAIPVPLITKLVLALLTAAILLIGIYPKPIMDLLG